jgi:hypothetical protein
MGWWDTGYKDDIVGDLPADSLTLFWKKLKNKPSWPLLIACVLRDIESHKNLYDDLGTEANIILTNEELRDAKKHSNFDQAEICFFDDLVQLIRDISRSYEEHVGRKPRSSEMLACFRLLKI